MPGTAEVTLRLPPPLETPIKVEERPGALVATSDGTLVMAAVPTEIDASIPGMVSLAEAEDAASRFEGFHNHAFPSCFVCGPEREEGDGLRIFPGELDGGAAAAPWRPHPDFADPTGVVHPEFVWAALDCPTGWAIFYSAPDAGLSLLGRLAARILRPVQVGKTYVAAAWPIGRDGRKHYATGAILSAEDEPCAVSRATWIELKS
jgi:acyl-coenzyme A thioesterase PaaI-like protein